ncbi:hypothetical protein OIU78_023730 [Salix suchowensis]|nr:hypothetical protein OIU78_023730 [Salix suchowensis]
MDSGFLIFRFRTEEDLQGILAKGPWMFGGKHIALQQWHPNFQFDKNNITTMPVWLRLYGLPFPLWSTEGLSKAASMVGKPLSSDEQTYHGTRLDYARLCVEVAAEDEYVHSFEIESPLSKAPCKVRVDYEWRPTRCKNCNTFGHSCHSQGKMKEKEKEQPHKAIATTADNHQTLPHDIEKSQNPSPHPSAANQKTMILPNQKNKSQQPPQQKTTNSNLHPDTVQQEGKTDTTHQPDNKSSENAASQQRQMKHTTHKQTNPKTDKALAEAKQKEVMIQDPEGTKGDEVVDENIAAGLQNKMDSLQSRTSRHTEEDHVETSSSRRSKANASTHSDDPSAQTATVKKKGGKKKRGDQAL